MSIRRGSNPEANNTRVYTYIGECRGVVAVNQEDVEIVGSESDERFCDILLQIGVGQPRLVSGIAVWVPTLTHQDDICTANWSTWEWRSQ
jgi:hypothetical protein